MYKARLTEEGAARYGLTAGLVVEYKTIHPLGKVIQNVIIEGEQTQSSFGFIGDDRSVDLITWPADFDYKGN